MEDDERGGGPNALSPNSQHRLKRALCNKRFVTPNRLAAKPNAHPDTIGNTAKNLLQMKVKYRVRQTHVSLGYRVQWAKARKNKPFKYWGRWLWSDEKWFFLVCKESGEWVWVMEDDVANEVRYVSEDKKPYKQLADGMGRHLLRWQDSTAHLPSRHEGRQGGIHVLHGAGPQQALLPTIIDKKYLYPSGPPHDGIYNSICNCARRCTGSPSQRDHERDQGLAEGRAPEGLVC